MPSLPTQSFSTLVQNIAAGIQGRAKRMINFSTGSTLRAVAEGFSGIFLWFQALVLQLLLATRLSTSVGTDVDTFTADFMPPVPGTNSPRLGSQYATGQLTYARFTAGPSTCFIPNGATVKTTDGSQSYEVIADPTNPTYSASLNGYTLAANEPSVIVAAEALVAGSAGNVVAGAISISTSSITGIDTVTNVAAFENGADFEQDSALKQRFSAYILGLSRGDVYGLTSAIEGVGVNVQWTLLENYNYDGSWRPGYFFVVADDGSGNPSAAFMQWVTDAANAVRPLSVQCGVFRSTILYAIISMQIATAAGFDHNTVCAQVAATVADNTNGLGLGNELSWSIIAAWAYSVPGVIRVNDVLINGQSGDTASILTTRPTLDGMTVVNYATVKATNVIVS